jgi:hypothetical protein
MRALQKLRNLVELVASRGRERRVRKTFWGTIILLVSVADVITVDCVGLSRSWMDNDTSMRRCVCHSSPPVELPRSAYPIQQKSGDSCVFERLIRRNIQFKV